MAATGTHEYTEHKFHYLDGLRGVAAACVVIRHTQSVWGGLHLPGAHLAVDLFFLLSGIVLAHAYDHRFRKGMTATAFMKIRLVRLYPLYLLGSAFGFFPILLSAALNGHLPFSWTPLSLGITAAFNLLFLPAPPGVGPTEQLFPFTDPAWSLLFELLVNLLFAVFWWRLSTGFLYVVCAIGALCIVATSVMTGSLDQGVLWPEFLGALGRVMFSFPLGVLIYRKTRGLKPSKISPLPWFLVAVILFWLPMSASAREIFEPFVVLFVLPLMVTHCALSKSPTSAVALLSFLGFVSYPIYVLHRPLFFLAEGEVNNLFHVSLHDYAPLSGVLFLCVMMAGSWLAGVVFDSPVRSWATRLVFPGKVRTLPYPG